MNIYELLQELSKHSREEIEIVLTILMEKGKIDFLSVNKAYVNLLEKIREDQTDQLCEANGLILLPFIKRKLVKSAEEDKTKGKSHYKYTQEALYWLNKSRMFNMKDTNEKFNYDEEYGKSQCVYERNKKNDWSCL